MDEDSCVSFKIGGIDYCISLNLTQYKKEKRKPAVTKIYLKVYFRAGDVEVHYQIIMVKNYKNKDYHVATQTLQFEG